MPSTSVEEVNTSTVSLYTFMLEVWSCMYDANLKVDYGLVTVCERNSEDFVFCRLKTLRKSLPVARQTRSTILTYSKCENCVSQLEQRQRVT